MSLTPEDIRLILSGKVDSRVKETAGNPLQTHPLYKLERTYCVACGKPKGYVSQESSKYIAANNIIVVCDDCDMEFRKLGLAEAPIKEEIVPK